MSCTGIGCVSLLVLFFIGYIGSEVNKSGSTSPNTAPAPPTSDSVEVQGVTSRVSEVESMMRDLKASGMITGIAKNNNEVQINRRMWESASLDVKKGMTIGCAQYFKAHGESSLATLVDNRTGKVLATFGSWAGVTINGD